MEKRPKTPKIEITRFSLKGPCREEDKYGNIAMLKKMYEDYCCTACSKNGPTEFLVYKEGDDTTLVCLKCGFEKPCPQPPTKKS